MQRKVISLKDRLVKVFHIISSAAIAGGERHLLDLIKYSNKSIQHIVGVPYPGPFVQALEEMGCSYVVVQLKHRFSLNALRNLIQWIRLNNVNIIHTHGYRANFHGRLAGLLTGLKCITTVHVSLFDYLDTPLVIRYFYIFLEKVFSFKTKKYLCVSNAMLADMLKLGIRRHKIILIHNGIDLDRFYPRSNNNEFKKKLGINSETRLIGTVGRMVTEKGQIYLIEALKYLQPEVTNLKCLFIGEGPMLQKLKEKAKALGVADMCIFPGVFREIEYIYSLLEVFVLPSLREPFGLVLLEAMAMEIPVVATATGGPLDIIQSGINGFLVPARDAEALASNIQLLLLNRAMTAAIAQSGRITVQRNFNVQETIHQLDNIYFSL